MRNNQPRPSGRERDWLLPIDTRSRATRKLFGGPSDWCIGCAPHDFSNPPAHLLWGASDTALAFVGSYRASAVSSIQVFIRVGLLKVEDWYVRSGGRRHLLSMIRSR